jgi:hypothetical protein
MATNFNTTGLAAFTAADPTKVLQLYLLTGKGTKDYFSYEEGVKYQTKIPYISNVDVDVSTGAIAGYNTGSGQTTAKDVTLVNYQMKIFETYTKEALNSTILASLGRGTDPAELPMKDMIYALKGKKLFATNEKWIWQADTSTTIQAAGTTLNAGDGILAQLRAGVGAYGNPAAAFSGQEDASAIANVNKMYSSLINLNEAYATVDTILAMSPANFSVYSRALYNLNGVVTTQTVGADGKGLHEVYIPGTMCKAVEMIGLTGKNDMVLTTPDNIIVAYDLVNEDETLEFIYNPYARWHELAGQYKLGVKVADVSACVKTS